MCLLCAMRAPDDPLAALDQHVQSSTTRLAAPWTLDQIATQLTHGYWGGISYRWQLDAGRTLTYNTTGLTVAEAAIATAALEAWSEVTGITFLATTGAAQITFDNNSAGAYATFDTWNGWISSAFINVQSNWYPGLNLNNYNLQTYIHEIGHALGLGHAGNYNGGATYGVDNLYDNDSWLTSVMSYFDQVDNTLVPGSFAWLATVMPADIVAIQNLYGFTGTANGGNSIYGVNGNVGGYLQTLLAQWTGSTTATTNVYVGEPIAFTIYDSTGNDTIDFSTFSQNQEISLIALTYSDIGGLTDNLTIARGVVVENATSGGGNDTLSGNEVANLLRANAGNDTLTGNHGQDTLEGGSGNDVLYGGEGDDTLDGGLGSDRLEGGLGNDLYEVDSAADVVVEAAGQGTDTVRAAVTSYTLGANLDILILTLGTNVTGVGNTLDNTIAAGAGNDTLQGLAGVDWLYGDAGNDSLDGGSETDALWGGRGPISCWAATAAMRCRVRRGMIPSTAATGSTGSSAAMTMTGWRAAPRPTPSSAASATTAFSATAAMTTSTAATARMHCMAGRGSTGCLALSTMIRFSAGPRLTRFSGRRGMIFSMAAMAATTSTAGRATTVSRAARGPTGFTGKRGRTRWRGATGTTSFGAGRMPTR